MEGLLLFMILIVCYVFGYRMGVADARKEIKRHMEDWINRKEEGEEWQE